ncbi:hypothetical protein CGRA01v4_02596 [Colletotrichum graminicola]|uniref:Uncharacterized protein n=1 Tax=Colletotrichum graminicola (strain M1.001 / M2 / FGSC 10212) TaxID=645133 RepID=E3Q4B9_COLGM|nr:uncharacterized protein GLRG_00575 [Colletotrichum graminicola M1.001]EFQ25431.1 hypothetical protein GLRG_00575 [Colletotrichum graminicola M1.001]WDK11317.1 hypothetical protein CGRA01v4_02596 [Colletotrichum graminicola]
MAVIASPTSRSDASDSSTPFGILKDAPIPQKFTVIPKNQNALLERKDSWISALNNDSQKGAVNVPPNVLETVKYFHTSRTLPPAAQKPNVEGSSGPLQMEAELAVPSAPSQEQEDGVSLNSSPGIPVSSWPESLPPSPHTSRQHLTPSPAPSIKSQIVTERQSGPLSVAPESPPPDRPSSPQIASSPPMQPAPKRHIAPLAGSKRRPLEAFPSSSAGLEDELETAIPDALVEATPPINRMAARVATASQAVTSPPCGQGSMVPSTYRDVKSPEEKAQAPNKRRCQGMKVIVFSSTPEDQPKGSSNCGKTPARPAIPLAAPLQEPSSLSSAFPIASALPKTDTQSSLRTSRNVEATNGQQAGATPRPVPPAPGPAHDSEDHVMTGTNTVPEARRAMPNDGSFDQPAQSSRCQDIISYLDHEWNAENLDWLPPKLKHFRSALTARSLENLQKITSLAIKNGTRLSRLWSEPDGLLYRSAQQQTNGKLNFPEELVHMTLDLYGTEMAGIEGHPARAPEEVLKGPSRQTSRHEVATQTRTTNPSPPTSPTVVQAPRDAPSSPQVTNKHERPIETPPRPPREVVAKTFARDPLEAFRNAYPSYSGSTGDFVKACLTIKDLRRKLLLPKWLYDDFIRAFVDGFIPYIETLDDDEAPLSAYQWYVEYVDSPAFQGGVVTRENLHQVFRVYHSAYMSARGSLSGKTSTHPGVGLEPSTETTGVDIERGPQTRIPQVVEPRPRVRPKEPHNSSATSADLSFLPDQPSPAVAQETTKGLMNGRQSSIEAKDDDLLPIGSHVPLTKVDKGKQRMSVKEDQVMRDAPASAPAIQRHKNVFSGDREVTHVSSTPRPRTANPNDAGSSKDESRSHNGRSVSNITPTSQTTTRNSVLSEGKRVSAVKLWQNEFIAETPPRNLAAPAKTATQHPAVRRSLPVSFDSATPLASMPSMEAQRSGTPRSTLSASTQAHRVKKPRYETEEERKKRKMMAKLEKMAKEGRLAPPLSSMPRKS